MKALFWDGQGLGLDQAYPNPKADDRIALVLKSTVAEEHALSLAPLVINEVTVVGSRCGPFPPAIQALAQKNITVTPLIEKIYPLNEAIEAVAHAGRAGALKVLLRA